MSKQYPSRPYLERSDPNFPNNPHTVIFGMTYIIDGPNKGVVVAVAAPGCMKANAIANTTAKIIKKTSKAGLLLRPQPTVKKTPRNTPKDRNIISR